MEEGGQTGHMKKIYSSFSFIFRRGVGGVKPLHSVRDCEREFGNGCRCGYGCL